ncbi:MAG: glycosyltransferase family 9 protein [Chloroherpetonaceae bacterium]
MDKTAASHNSHKMKQVLKQLEYALKVLLYKGVLARLFRNPPFKEPLNPKDVKRILILRRDMLGDMVITTWLFRAIQDLNPKTEIDVIASMRGIGAIRHHRRLSKVWVFNESKWLALKTLWQARKRNYDAVLCLSLGGLTVDGIIANVIAPHAPKLTIKQPKKHNLYQILFNKEVETNYLHEPLWRSQKSVLDTLFGIDYPEQKIHQEIFTDEKAEQRVETFLCGHSLEKRQYLVLNLSARMPYRRWGKENFITFLKLLTQAYPDLKIVLTSIAEEQMLAQEICRSVQSENIFVLPETFGLEETIVITKYARLLVSPDTANVHIAATFGVPSVILCTPISSNIMWTPLKAHFINIYTDAHEPITTIAPQRVMTHVAQMLAQHQTSSNIQKQVL